MQLKFQRIKFDTIHGAAFNDYMVAGDLIGGADEDDNELLDISSDIIQGKFYRGNSGPIDQSIFMENLVFENDKGLFESEKPLIIAYANMRLTIQDLPIDFLSDDEDEIIIGMKDRIERVETFIAKFITNDEFDFEV